MNTEEQKYVEGGVLLCRFGVKRLCRRTVALLGSFFAVTKLTPMKAHINHQLQRDLCVTCETTHTYRQFFVLHMSTRDYSSTTCTNGCRKVFAIDVSAEFLTLSLVNDEVVDSLKKC